jgi:hypothetical protein
MAATFLGSITGTTLTVTSLVSGTITVGNALYGTGVLQGTFIVSGSGSLWTVNLSQTVVSDGSSLITATAFNNNISPGAPPLLWSDVNEAFTLINENFDVIIATIGGGSGLTPINFETLDTDLRPTTDNLRSLGSVTNRWKSVYTSEHTLVDPTNGVFLGNAQIKGIGLTVNLPANSTIGGDPITGIGTSLIIDPEKTFFKTIEVDAGNSVVATEFGDTLNLISGSGVSMMVSSGADSITISNTGVLSVAAGSGISVATVSGTSTITNAGVRSLQSTTALPSGRTTGAGINITAGTGDNIRVTNTGVITISSGVGITVSTDAATGDVTITNSAPAVNAFTQIEVNGDSANRLQADAVSDVLNITSGEGITLTKDPATDTLTITVNPVFDLRGSVFADDSTVMVDAVAGVLRGNFIGSVFADNSSQIIDGNTATVYGNIEATTLRTSEPRIVLGYLAGSTGGSGAVITIGSLAGATNQGTGAMAIGPYAGHTNQGISGMAIGPYAGYTGQGLTTLAVGAYAGQTNQGNVALAIGAFAGNDGQGTNAVAIGPYAGGTNQGAGSIAIGLYAGSLNQSANSIVLNASGVALNGSAAGLYIDPIRSTTSSARPVVYDSGTKELFYTSTLEFINSTISTSDSSGLIVDVQTTFNTDVTFENDIIVAERLTVKGSRVINLTELQAITAASTDFADFQTRIAALA